jgi:hypothetical protein
VRFDLRGEVVDAGGGRHGGGEVACGGVGYVVLGDVVVEGARESGAGRWGHRCKAANGGAGEESWKCASCRHLGDGGAGYIYGRYRIIIVR